MKRIALAALAALALAAGGNAVASASDTPAAAQLLSTGCASGKACVWAGSNYQGERAEFGRGFANNDWSGFGIIGGGDSAKNRLGTGYGFGIADGPPGNRSWSDCIGNNSERPSPPRHIFYVKVDPSGC